MFLFLISYLICLFLDEEDENAIDEDEDEEDFDDSSNDSDAERSNSRVLHKIHTGRVSKKSEGKKRGKK